jgi:beta-lactamase superfamily II metal-dependent hydrolase
MLFNVHSLPATYGDSFVIEYGESSNKTSMVLIDGGTALTANAISKLVEAKEKFHFELVIVTHVDRDHIEGVLGLLERPTLNFTIGDFWFNGWSHLNEGIETFGPDQGERLSAAVLAHNISWNDAFSGKAVVIEDDAKALPRIELPGGMTITLLSPFRSNLRSLIPKWKSDIEKAGLEPGYGETEYVDHGTVESFGTVLPSTDIEFLMKQSFNEDETVANGSSIAFIAEYAGQKVLFAGDSFPSVILKSLNLLSEKAIEIDLYKVSHHGSKGNTSPALIKKLICHQFLISTNGSNYGHPNDVTMARIVKLGSKEPKLIFNYVSDYNSPWDDVKLKKEYSYETDYTNAEGITVQLLD